LLVRVYYLLSIVLGRYKRRRNASAKRMAEKAKASVEYYNLAMARASEKIEETGLAVRTKANETAEFVGEYVIEDEELGEKWKELYGTVGLSRWFDRGSDER